MTPFSDTHKGYEINRFNNLRSPTKMYKTQINVFGVNVNEMEMQTYF